MTWQVATDNSTTHIQWTCLLVRSVEQSGPTGMWKQRQQTDEENSWTFHNRIWQLCTQLDIAWRSWIVFSETVKIVVFDYPVLPALFSVINSCGDIWTQWIYTIKKNPQKTRALTCPVYSQNSYCVRHSLFSRCLEYIQRNWELSWNLLYCTYINLLHFHYDCSQLSMKHGNRHCLCTAGQCFGLVCI
jgi:hypothetical protein